MRFRNSAKAVIIENEAVLAIEKSENNETWYLLPGGGQEFGENLIEALKREVKEETGAQVEVGELMFVREYIGKNHEFRSTDFDFHQVEFYFECKLQSPIDLNLATHLDSNQTGISWISLVDKNAKVYPSFLLNSLLERSPIKYYGDQL